VRDKKRGNDLPSIVSHNGIEIVGIPCEHPMLRKLSSLSFREHSMDQTHSRRGLEVGRSLARGSAMLFESSYKRVQRAFTIAPMVRATASRVIPQQSHRAKNKVGHQENWGENARGVEDQTIGRNETGVSIA
jgi:hypothetical protein